MSAPFEFAKWIPRGYQEKKARRPKKNVPDWANDDRAMKLRILTPALRQWRIAELYWRQNYTAREVAEELGMTRGAVKQAILRLLRMSQKTRTTN